MEFEESIFKGLVDQSTENNDPRSGGNEQYGYFAYFRTIFVHNFTDWPWETVKYISITYNWRSQLHI